MTRARWSAGSNTSHRRPDRQTVREDTASVVPRGRAALRGESFLIQYPTNEAGPVHLAGACLGCSFSLGSPASPSAANLPGRAFPRQSVQRAACPSNSLPVGCSLLERSPAGGVGAPKPLLLGSTNRIGSSCSGLCDAPRGGRTDRIRIAGARLSAGSRRQNPPILPSFAARPGRTLGPPRSPRPSRITAHEATVEHGARSFTQRPCLSRLPSGAMTGRQSPLRSGPDRGVGHGYPVPSFVASCRLSRARSPLPVVCSRSCLTP